MSENCNGLTRQSGDPRALAIRLREQIVLHETWRESDAMGYDVAISLVVNSEDVMREALAALTASEARQGALAQELEEARKDVMYHSDCRPNRRQAEAAAADAKALVDWRADVTVALQRPGGAHFADVPQHIRDLVQEVAALRAALTFIQANWTGLKQMPFQSGFESYRRIIDEQLAALASPPPEE